MGSLRCLGAARHILFISCLFGWMCLLSGHILAAQDKGGVVLHAMTVATSHGPVHFQVELALTPQEQDRGLMFRDHLPIDHGMLFDFGEPRMVVMWMKNTEIPLDMLFVDANGGIIHIKENATPYSLDTIPSGGPVRAVVELAGGAAKHYNISEGDKITEPVFK